jgi:hypothetical protein
MSYEDKSNWCDTVVLHVNVPTGMKFQMIAVTVYVERGQKFDQFPEYHMKTPLEDFSAKIRKEDFFRPTLKIESLHKNNNNKLCRSQKCNCQEYSVSASLHS